jgi:hypothetical protein
LKGWIGRFSDAFMPELNNRYSIILEQKENKIYETSAKNIKPMTKKYVPKIEKNPKNSHAKNYLYSLFELINVLIISQE